MNNVMRVYAAFINIVMMKKVHIRADERPEPA